MKAPVSARTAARLGAAGAMLTVVLLPSSAQALEPLPLPLPSLSTSTVTDLVPTAAPAAPAVPVVQPAPSPSPSPAAGPLDPVVSQLPAPVASPVASALASAPTAPAAVTAPAPAPAPAAVPRAQSPVRSNQQGAVEQVAAPGTGFAGFPGLRAGSFNPNAGTGASGLAPMTAAIQAGVLNRLNGPAVAQPPAVLPAAAPAASHPVDSVPGGLPLLAVVIAATTLGGASIGQLAAARSRRTS